MRSDHINAAFPFNVLVDLDYGVLQYVRTLPIYKNNKLFHQFFFGMESKDIKNILNERTDENPISVLTMHYHTKEEDRKIADELYNDIINNHYLEVQKRAVRTSCTELFKKFVDTNKAITPIAIYKNQYQKKYLEILFSDCLSSMYILLDQKDIKIKDIDACYVRYIDDLYNFGEMHGKNIYISDSHLNLDMNLYQIHKIALNMDSNILDFASENVLHIFSIYPKQDEAYNHYFKEEENDNL